MKNISMKTKNILPVLFILFVAAFNVTAKDIPRVPSYATASGKGNIDNDSAQIAAMEQRVHEIQGMDIQNMSPYQKRSLRVEVKQMMTKANSYGQHPYRACGIASCGVLLIILFATYAVLR
jgi:hypothetical protein